MNYEELIKHKVAIESDRYALYMIKQISNTIWTGYRLNKVTKEIDSCKISTYPKIHVIEVNHNGNVQKIISEFNIKNKSR